MDKVIKVEKNREEHGFIATYENGNKVNCECFHGGEVELKIGDVVWDERYEEYLNITTQRQIDNYRFVAPELYIIIKLK